MRRTSPPCLCEIPRIRSRRRAETGTAPCRILRAAGPCARVLERGARATPASLARPRRARQTAGSAHPAAAGRNCPGSPSRMRRASRVLSAPLRVAPVDAQAPRGRGGRLSRLDVLLARDGESHRVVAQRKPTRRDAARQIARARQYPTLPVGMATGCGRISSATMFPSRSRVHSMSVGVVPTLRRAMRR